MKIAWRDGFRTSGADAKGCYEEIEIIRRREGSIKPEAVVIQAKRKASKMHSLFEWDDTKAAKAHRIEQARGVIRSIEVVYAEAPGIKARVYHVTTELSKGKEKPRNVYQSTEELLKDPIARDALLTRAITDALGYRKRYSCLSELAKVFSAMDNFVCNADQMLKAK